MHFCYHAVVVNSEKTYTERHATSITRPFAGLLRLPLKLFFDLLPASAPMYIYTTLLRPPLLRKPTNALLRQIIPSELRLPEGTLYLNPDDLVVSAALSLGVYEVFFTAALRKRLTKGMTVVDIGANLGYYTLIASARAERVIAFEPEQANANLLEKTLAYNQRDNITLIRKGLGEKTATLSLAVHPYNKGRHTFVNTDEKGVTSVEVEISTLDEELLKLGSPKIDLIKIDIEGWEAKAFRGATNTLQASSPIIMFEFAPQRIRAAGDDPLVMLDTLKALGYTLFIIDEHHDALFPLDEARVIASLNGKDSYINILAEPRKP